MVQCGTARGGGRRVVGLCVCDGVWCVVLCCCALLCGTMHAQRKVMNQHGGVCLGSMATGFRHGSGCQGLRVCNHRVWWSGSGCQGVQVCDHRV